MADILKLIDSKNKVIEDINKLQEEVEKKAAKAEELLNWIRTNNIRFSIRGKGSYTVDQYTEKKANKKTGIYTYTGDEYLDCIEFNRMHDLNKEYTAKIDEAYDAGDKEKVDELSKVSYENFENMLALKQKIFNYFDLSSLLAEKGTYAKYRANYEKRLAKYNDQIESLTNAVKNDIPAAFRDLVDGYAEKFYKNYIQVKNKLELIEAQYASDAEFYDYCATNKISGRDLRLLYKSDEDLRKEARYEAQALVLNLYYTVVAYVGEVESSSGIFIASDGSLNGIVNGSKGSAKVQTILAGGYNIQCLHFRVLVHKINR